MLCRVAAVSREMRRAAGALQGLDLAARLANCSNVLDEIGGAP